MNAGVPGTHVEDFLNPKSMPTPAAAGAVVALIAGALFQSFGVSVALCTVVLSFMIGLVVFHSKEFRAPGASKISKSVLYVVNSLIIFAMATGATSVLASDVLVQQRPYFHDWTKSAGQFKEIKNDGDYLLTTDVSAATTGGARGVLQRVGVVGREYDVTIRVLSNGAPIANDIATVELVLPEEFFDQNKLVLTPDEVAEGVRIKAWSEFPVEATITEASGQRLVLRQIVRPPR